MVSGGEEDPPSRWTVLNHTIAVNKLLGVEHRVSMANRATHNPTEESNEQIYRFFDYWLNRKQWRHIGTSKFFRCDLSSYFETQRHGGHRDKTPTDFVFSLRSRCLCVLEKTTKRVCRKMKGEKFQNLVFANHFSLPIFRQQALFSIGNVPLVELHFGCWFVTTSGTC